MYAAIVFLPLLGSLVAGFFGRRIGARNAEIVTSSLLGVAALLSWIAFFHVGLGHHPAHETVASWIKVGELSIDWAFRVDTLTVVMLVVVTTVVDDRPCLFDRLYGA